MRRRVWLTLDQPHRKYPNSPPTPEMKLFSKKCVFCHLQTYVQYMKFARRAEGIKSARSVFKKAREDPRSRYHVFVAAALMEYYCSKDKDIAFRIFELGLKRFGGSPEYVMCYVDYLSHLNGNVNA